jgi:hypothetical protein
LIFCEFFLHILPIFWLNGKPDTNESKKKRGGSKTQTNGEKAARGREWGPAAGAQASAATQRTCTSDSGTNVCTTLSLRHDNAMTDTSGKGGCERDNSTATMKLELYGFRV